MLHHGEGAVLRGRAIGIKGIEVPGSACCADRGEARQRQGLSTEQSKVSGGSEQVRVTVPATGPRSLEQLFFLH
jgi:hypothetical protein